MSFASPIHAVSYSRQRELMRTEAAPSALQARCPAHRMHPKNLIHPNDRTVIPQEAMKRGVQLQAGDQGLHFVAAEARDRRQQAARMARMRREVSMRLHGGNASVSGHDGPVTPTSGEADALHGIGAPSRRETVREGFYGGSIMQNTFSSLFGNRIGSNPCQGSARYPSVNQTREHNINNAFPGAQSAQALIRRSARVNVEFTKDAWKQFVALRGNIFSAFIHAFTVKADMALYIRAHEEKGIRLDNLCQEVCYEQGVFFLMKNVSGIWYITKVFTTNGDVGFAPVFFWTRIKRGCDVLAARVLLSWRRLTTHNMKAFIN